MMPYKKIPKALSKLLVIFRSYSAIMQKNSRNTLYFFYLLIGFGIGLLILLLHYLSLFRISPLSFSFRGFGHLHLNNPFNFLFDLLPVFGVFIANQLFTFIEKGRKKNESLNESWKNKNKIIAAIAREIASGNLSVPIPHGEDEVFKNLALLKDNIRQNKMNENLRIREDARRYWTSEGIAHFGGILREYNGDLQELAYKLIKELVKYLEANQGGFFVRETDTTGEKYLNLLACYAYKRKKFADKRIPWGEGIIGTTALEKKSFYITDIPDNYLEITSGLGKTNPKILLLTPLVNNEDVMGILEIASFSELEEFQIRFVEQVAAIIAMTLENIVNIASTEILFNEAGNQADAFALHEEEIRREMEILRNAREQAAMQTEKYVSFSNTVNHTLLRAEYDVNGMLLYANTKFIRKLGYSGNQEVEGKHISFFVDRKDREWFSPIWEGLVKGGIHFEGYMKHITKTGQELWTMSTYTAMRKESGEVDKILFLAIDNTLQKKLSLDIEAQMTALNKINLKAEFTPDGKLFNFNKLFLHSFKFDEPELEKMTLFDFIDQKDIENISEEWGKVIMGQAFQSQIRMITRLKEEKWFRASLTSVNNMYGEVSKVIFLANEITNEKIMEIEGRKQTEILKDQEEKFRLANLSLSRELKEIKLSMDTNAKRSEAERALFSGLLQKENRILLLFSTTGTIHFVNDYAYKFFGISAEKKILTTHALISLIKEKQKVKFWVDILKPTLTIEPQTSIVLLPDNNLDVYPFLCHINVREAAGSRIFSVSLGIEK